MRHGRRGATRSAVQHSAAQRVQAAHARQRHSARTCTCVVHSRAVLSRVAPALCPRGMLLPLPHLCVPTCCAGSWCLPAVPAGSSGVVLQPCWLVSLFVVTCARFLSTDTTDELWLSAVPGHFVAKDAFEVDLLLFFVHAYLVSGFLWTTSVSPGSRFGTRRNSGTADTYACVWFYDPLGEFHIFSSGQCS